MVVSGSCPMAPASEVTRPQHRVWLESHSHSNAPERTRDCAIPGTLRELPKSQRCLDRTEMGEHVRRGSGLQEKGLKRMHTGLSRVLSTPVLNYECYVEWWRSAREPGEHQSQERLGLNLPLILLSHEESLRVWEPGNDLAKA